MQKIINLFHENWKVLKIIYDFISNSFLWTESQQMNEAHMFFCVFFKIHINAIFLGRWRIIDKIKECISAFYRGNFSDTLTKKKTGFQNLIYMLYSFRKFLLISHQWMCTEIRLEGSSCTNCKIFFLGGGGEGWFKYLWFQ